MTTILTVRRDDRVALGGDGQVTLDDQVMKHEAAKIRSLNGGRIIVGFAGGAADALELMERFENVLNKYQAQTERACVELARKWRTEKTMRRLESMMIVVDRDHSLLVSGGGDVISPDDGILSIGSGSDAARAAARALRVETDLSPDEIVKKALSITADIDVYTNDEIRIEQPADDSSTDTDS